MLLAAPQIVAQRRRQTLLARGTFGGLIGVRICGPRHPVMQRKGARPVKRSAIPRSGFSHERRGLPLPPASPHIREIDPVLAPPRRHSGSVAFHRGAPGPPRALESLQDGLGGDIRGRVDFRYTPNHRRLVLVSEIHRANIALPEGFRVGPAHPKRSEHQSAQVATSPSWSNVFA